MNPSDRQLNYMIGFVQLLWAALIIWLAYETVGIASRRGIP